MKKIFSFYVLAMILITSCSKEITEPEIKQKKEQKSEYYTDGTPSVASIVINTSSQLGITSENSLSTQYYIHVKVNLNGSVTTNDNLKVELNIVGFGSLNLSKSVTSSQNQVTLTSPIFGSSFNSLTQILVVSKTYLTSNPSNAETKYITVQY